jgi:hypothetical protein
VRSSWRQSEPEPAPDQGDDSQKDDPTGDKAVEDPKGETPAEMWRSQPMGKVEYLEALEGDDADLHTINIRLPAPRIQS